MRLSDTERATLADIEERLRATDPDMVRWFAAASSFMVDNPSMGGARRPLDDAGTVAHRTRTAALHAGTLGRTPTFGPSRAHQPGHRRGILLVLLLVAALVAALSLVAAAVARSSADFSHGLSSLATPTAAYPALTGPAASHAGAPGIGPR